MTIALIICIPVTALATGFLVLKSVQLGLRWQLQVQAKQEPTMEVNNPIEPIMQKQEENRMVNILDEYLNGARG